MSDTVAEAPVEPAPGSVEFVTRVLALAAYGEALSARVVGDMIFLALVKTGVLPLGLGVEMVTVARTQMQGIAQELPPASAAIIERHLADLLAQLVEVSAAAPPPAPTMPDAPGLH